MASYNGTFEVRLKQGGIMMTQDVLLSDVAHQYRGVPPPRGRHGGSRRPLQHVARRVGSWGEEGEVGWYMDYSRLG